MTRSKLTAFLADAEAAGFTVTVENGRTSVMRYSKSGRLLRGIHIHANGTAIDATVADLRHARGMRSYADMRSALRIAK